LRDGKNPEQYFFWGALSSCGHKGATGKLNAIADFGNLSATISPVRGALTFATHNVYYLRGKSGARVFYRQKGDTIEILAKADKSNEIKVIKILTELYGK
jgi:hypothetical protein